MGAIASTAGSADPAVSDPDTVAAAAKRARTLRYVEDRTCSEQLDVALGFDAVSARALVTSCFVTSRALLAIRSVMALYSLAVTVWFIYTARTGMPTSYDDRPVLDGGGPYAHSWSALASLTGWTLVIMSAYLWLAVLLTARHLCGAFSPNSLLTDSYTLRITYLCFEFGFTWSLVACALFWIAEFPVSKLTAIEMIELIHLHSACLAFAIADLLLSRVKFEFTHYIAGALTALTYVAVYAIGFGPNHSALADLKWNSFLAVLLVFGVVFGIVLSFVVGVMITSARDLCHAHSDDNQPIIIPHGGGGTMSATASLAGDAGTTDSDSLLHREKADRSFGRV